MVISDVKALSDLVTQASSFITQTQVGWYKRSAELDAFKDQVRLLSERRLQWTNQLQRHGISGDELLLRAVKAATDSLQQQQQHVEKLQKNPLLRFRKRAFPSDISYAVNRLFEIVNAGPQLLTERALTFELLEKAVEKSPVRLPFIPDRKYVLISDSFLEVQQALENEKGPRVVSVYGAPGTGKSSLAKYIALHYQEQKTSGLDSMEASLQRTVTFPNGVQYLLCGLGANKRVKQLLAELLDNLGFGSGSTPSPNDSSTTAAAEAAGIQDGEYFTLLRSYQRRLQSRLVEQKLLIILDDLWEMEVLKAVLIPAKGVRYLITSQNREIWRDSEQIRLKYPTMAEARKIMANHTRGLPRTGEFPESIQGITDTIVWELGYHPLSLATVGITIRKATDAAYWKERRTHLRALLESDRDAPNGPPAYERPYPLTVGASIRLMEECIPPAALQFLYLMALLSSPAGRFMGPALRKDVVQFFYACVQPSRSNFEYNSLVEYLEDRSLVESRNEGAEGVLVAHSLRIQHMQGRRNLELKNLGAQIVGGSGDQHVEPIQNGEQESLVVIMSAIHFGEPFLNLVATKFSDLYNARAINDGISTRVSNAGIDELQLVRRARYHLSHVLSSLYSLLRPGGEDEVIEIWKQQAHEHTRKVIIKFVCRGKLDDSSMAQLLQLSQNTSIACATLKEIIRMDTLYNYDLCDQNVAFSSVYPETMNTLLALLHSNSTTSKRQAAAISALSYVLRFEKEDTIVNVTEIWKELLAMDSKPLIQIACMDAFANSPASYTTPKVWKRLVTLLVNGKDSEVRRHAGRIIWSSHYEPSALTSQTDHFPDSIKMLFILFSSQDRMRNDAGRILLQLSSTPENRIKLMATQSVLQGLVDILTNVEAGWQVITHDIRRYYQGDEFSLWRPATAAKILGNLALTKELGETIVAWPGVVEGLLTLQALELGTMCREFYENFYDHEPFRSFERTFVSTRTLTILHSHEADPRLKDPPPWSQVLEAYKYFGGCHQPVQEVACVIFYVSRVETHLEIESYQDALADLDLAGDSLKQVLEGESGMHHGSWTPISPIRYMKIYVRALSGDYVGALGDLNSNLESTRQNTEDLLTNALLRTLSEDPGDLPWALDDLNSLDFSRLPLTKTESCPCYPWASGLSLAYAICGVLYRYRKEELYINTIKRGFTKTHGG